MFKLGLTGSMATGKSTALDAFAQLGYQVYSADQEVHQLYTGAAVVPVSKRFPDAITKGRVDRAKLSALLHEDPENLVHLNKIVHPLIQSSIKTFFSTRADAGDKLVIVDIPLLFEAGYQNDFDAIAVTWCLDELQRRRALSRPEMNVDKLQLILAHQMPQSEKKRRADFLIDTNGSLKETREQVQNIANLCLARNQQSQYEP